MKRCVHLGQVLWRPTTFKRRQFSLSNRHSTISTRQTKYHEALLSSANNEVRCDCMFADDDNIADGGMTVGLWKLSLDGRRPPWYQPLAWLTRCLSVSGQIAFYVVCSICTLDVFLKYQMKSYAVYRKYMYYWRKRCTLSVSLFVYFASIQIGS